MSINDAIAALQQEVSFLDAADPSVPGDQELFNYHLTRVEGALEEVREAFEALRESPETE